MCKRKLRHPARRQLDDPDAGGGESARARPLRIRLARATAGARYKKIESKSCSPSSCSPVRQAGWSGLSNSDTWKTGATPSSLHARPHRIEVRVRERLPVDRGRGDHGQAQPLRPHPSDLLHRPRRIVQQDVGHAEETSLAIAADVGDEAVVGPGVGALRSAVRGQPLFPQEPVVREHDGSVESELRRATPGGRRRGGRSRAPTLRTARARAHRAGAGGGPPRSGSNARGSGPRAVSACCPARSARAIRRHRRRWTAHRSAVRGRCTRTRSSSTRTGAGRRRWSAASHALPPQSTSGRSP